MRVIMLILHFIGLAMGLRVSFTHAFLGPTLSRVNQHDDRKFRVRLKGLCQMVCICPLLLLMSGIYLILPYWPTILSSPMLIYRSILFVVLIILIVRINWLSAKIFKKETSKNLKTIELIGKFAMLVGLGVLQFSH